MLFRSNLDLVIAVDTAAVHLAGAMGKQTYLLDANKLWYWNNRIAPTSPISKWYPHTYVIPREHMLAPWGQPIKQVIEYLEKR